MLLHPPIKILFLIDELNVGGTETQLIWLAENLPRNQFDPVIAVLRKTSFQEFLTLKTPIIDFKWVGFPILRNLFLLYKIYKYFTCNKVDILQVQFVESEIYSNISLYFCIKKINAVFTRRNMYHWVTNDKLKFKIIRFFSKKYNFILTNSHAVKQRCQEIERIQPEKIKVIQNAVDVNKFKNINTVKSKQKLGLDAGQLVVGVVGNWRPVKGNVTFLRAAEYISQEIDNVVFVLVGNGPQERELRELAERLHIENKTIFIQDVDDASHVIKAFDIAVQPSSSESFSNVLLEYMAAARPIVATNVGDAARMITHGYSGLLVEAGDPAGIAQAVIQLFKNEKLGKNMGAKAAADAQAFWSTESVLEKYISFYSETINHQGK